MRARLQYGPFDGQSGHVNDPTPHALDVTRCRGCGCGRPTHYRVVDIAANQTPGYARYELVDVDPAGALYRHADTYDPITERTIVEALTS